MVKTFFSKSVLLFLLATCSFLMPVYVIVTIRRGSVGAHIPPIYGENADLLTLILVCLMILLGCSRIYATYIYCKNLDCTMLKSNIVSTVYLYILFTVLIYIMLLYPMFMWKYSKFLNILVVFFDILYIYSVVYSIVAFIRIKNVTV